MNSDRCYHVPVAPGQRMCTCQDYAVWLRFVIETQAEYIVDLERRMRAGGVSYGLSATPATVGEGTCDP